MVAVVVGTRKDPYDELVFSSGGLLLLGGKLLPKILLTLIVAFGTGDKGVAMERLQRKSPGVGRFVYSCVVVSWVSVF